MTIPHPTSCVPPSTSTDPCCPERKDPVTRTAPKEKLWTRDLILAFVVNLALTFVFYMFMTTMALYAVERFGASDTQSGLASSMFVIGATIARLFAGNLIDLVGRRRILGIALATFLVASVAYVPLDLAGSTSLTLLLTVRGVHGLAFGIASTAAMALAQSLIPASRRAEGTGYFTLSSTLATALGPFLALQLVHGPGYTALFVGGVVAAVVAMLVALGLRTPDTPLDPDERGRLRRFHPRDLLHPGVVPVASFMLVMAIGFAGILTFLNSFAGERGLQTGASMFFLVYAAVLVLARFVAGPLQDRRGDNLVVYSSVVLYAAGLAVLGAARSDVVLLVAAALLGTGYGTLMSAMQAIAVGRAPVHRVGIAISTHYFMLDLGVGLGPVLLGLLLAHLGYGEMYLVLAGVSLAGAALYHLVHGRRARAHRAAAAATVAAEVTEATDSGTRPAVTVG